jgi:hypothetical protein
MCDDITYIKWASTSKISSRYIASKCCKEFQLFVILWRRFEIYTLRRVFVTIYSRDTSRDYGKSLEHSGIARLLNQALERIKQLTFLFTSMACNLLTHRAPRQREANRRQGIPFLISASSCVTTRERQDGRSEQHCVSRLKSNPWKIRENLRADGQFTSFFGDQLRKFGLLCRSVWLYL